MEVLEDFHTSLWIVTEKGIGGRNEMMVRFDQKNGFNFFFRKNVTLLSLTINEGLDSIFPPGNGMPY